VEATEGGHFCGETRSGFSSCYVIARQEGLAPIGEVIAKVSDLGAPAWETPSHGGEPVAFIEA
jgi:hypothetical protein